MRADELLRLHTSQPQARDALYRRNNDLARRIWEHREGIGSKFTKKYRVHRLVYAEPYDEIERAIQREKTMKEWPRAWKIRTIERDNPEWDDLYDKLNG